MGADDAIREILVVLSAWQHDYGCHATTRSQRPFVLLTYAQSLDGAIASAPGVRTPVSCAETRRLTHSIRLVHDAILVGVGTVLADNPQLTARDFITITGEVNAGVKQPRAVVLDSSGARFPADKNLLVDPLILVANDVDPQTQRSLLDKNVTFKCCKRDMEGQRGLEWMDLLGTLGQVEPPIATVMVEGGAKIISSLLAVQDGCLVDAVVITVSSNLLGREGLKLDHPSNGGGTAWSRIDKSSSRWIPVGEDVVFIAKMSRPEP